MFTPVNEVSNWRDLQNKVCHLFKEMDYEAEVARTVELAGRGNKEIDVYVKDPLASHNQIYLIECKHWESNIPQEVVHGFKFVMESAGANTGFIISRNGFQSGAKEAARFTNINLVTFEELQHIYGNEWLKKQKSKLAPLIDSLRSIYNLHYEQFNPATINNNMRFNTAELYSRLCYFHKWVGSLMLTIHNGCPESYLGPEPVKLADNPSDPAWKSNGWFEIASVREYFRVVHEAATRCITEFEELRNSASERFDSLPNEEQDSLFSQSLAMLREDSPIRVLKEKLSPEEYHRILRLIA